MAEAGAERAALVLVHTIGVDGRVWDRLARHLPQALDVFRIDLPGCGESPGTPTASMGALISDVEGRLETAGITGATLVGHGVGGLVAQGLAAKRLDLVSALVLWSTAAKLSTREKWTALAQDLRRGGHAALAEAHGRYWLAPRADPTHARDLDRLLRRQPTEALARLAEAASGTDFYTTTAALRLPTLALAADRDALVPPDLNFETGDLVPGSRRALIAGAGHMAMLEAPERAAEHLTDFLRQTGRQP